jgi:Na+/H+-dicarboxylate symporter
MPAWSQVILEMFPRNAVAAFSNGKLLQVVVFALFIGVTRDLGCLSFPRRRG